MPDRSARILEPSSTRAAKTIHFFAESLKTTAERLASPAFERVVASLLATLQHNDRSVFFTGVGKQKAIAHKSAATLASVGLRAFCLDATDAAHGDLGLVRPHDCVVFLSVSGGSEELTRLLPSLHQREALTIAVCGNDDSVLARDCRICLPVFFSSQVPPLDGPRTPSEVLPTLSCLTILAVCDAMTLVILDELSPSLDVFAANHPAGTLGRGLNTRISAITIDLSRLREVSPGAPLSEIVDAMTANGCGAALVAEGSLLVGIITDGDIRRASQLGDAGRRGDTVAADIMSRDVLWVDCDETLLSAATTLEHNSRKPVSVAVVRGRLGAERSALRFVTGEPVGGLVRLHDIVQGLLAPRI